MKKFKDTGLYICCIKTARQQWVKTRKGGQIEGVNPFRLIITKTNLISTNRVRDWLNNRSTADVRLVWHSFIAKSMRTDEPTLRCLEVDNLIFRVGVDLGRICSFLCSCS